MYLRKDRYNKKITKYYVVYEEGDESLSENEERQEQRDVEAPCQGFKVFPFQSIIFAR